MSTPTYGTTVVLRNGHLVGLHPTSDEAFAQAKDILRDWERHADCGSDVRKPRLECVPFEDWMLWSSDFLS